MLQKIVFCGAALFLEHASKWVFIRDTSPTMLALHPLHSALIVPFARVASLNCFHISSFVRGILQYLKNTMFFFEVVLNMFFTSCFKRVLNSLTTLS